jgi:Abortive infection C-terminus
VCKNILDDYGVEYRDGADMMELYKGVQRSLSLTEAVKDSKKDSEAAVKSIRALVTTVQSLAELRNELGLGHGRVRPSPALTRHARLALNASVAVCELLLDTWHERRADEAAA